MKITVLSDPIPVFEITIGLLAHGIVVLATSRPNAEWLTERVIESFSEENPESDLDWISHMAFEVHPNLGWVDFLVNTNLFPQSSNTYEYEIASAVKRWTELGSKQKYVYASSA
jgi:hypothetical protein